MCPSRESHICRCHICTRTVHGACREHVHTYLCTRAQTHVCARFCTHRIRPHWQRQQGAQQLLRRVGSWVYIGLCRQHPKSTSIYLSVLKMIASTRALCVLRAKHMALLMAAHTSVHMSMRMSVHMLELPRGTAAPVHGHADGHVHKHMCRHVRRHAC